MHHLGVLHPCYNPNFQVCGIFCRFMKLRLDRVLKGEIESEKSVAEVLKSANPADLTFEKPEVWTAPYPKYGEGWWTPFLPPQEQ